MRGIQCESCSATQPPDWKAGQRCVSCGSAVRPEQRCAACTRFTPVNKFCRHCAAELVPESWYGAARMLVAAGVDGLSLASRVAALDEGQREVFSSRFAVQRAALGQHVDAARWVEGFLCTTGHADRLEDEWVSRLPVPAEWVTRLQTRLPSPVDIDQRLTALADEAPEQELRDLAQMALAWRGQANRFGAQRHVSATSALAEEAVLLVAHQSALGQLRSEPQLDDWLASTKLLRERQPSRPDLAHARVVALKAAASRGRLQQAVGELKNEEASWPEVFLLERLEPPLRQGLHHERQSVALGCALALEDEATLERLLSAEGVAEVARNALGRFKSGVLARQLANTTDPAQKAKLICALRPPLALTEVLAVVAALEVLPPHDLRRALQAIEHAPFSDTPSEGRAALEQWLRRAPSLEPETAFELLRWASQTGVTTAPYRLASDIAPYLDAAAASDVALSDGLIAVLFESGPWPSVTTLLVRWLDDDERWPRTLECLLSVIGDLHASADPPDDRAERLFMAAWNALGPDGRSRFAPRFAERTWRDRGSERLARLRENLFDWHFAHPEERRISWQALASLRHDLELRRDPRVVSLDGGDPVRHFVLLSSWAEVDAPPLLNALFNDLGDDPRLAGLLDPVFEVASTLLRQGLTRLGLWLAAIFMSQVVNRFREAPHGAYRTTALGLAAKHQALQQVRAASAPNEPNDDVSGFDEQMTTELRLVSEVVDREEAQRQAQADRAAQQEARAQAMAAEAKAQADVAIAAQRKAEADLAAASVALAQATSVGNEAANEVLLPDQPLQTLAQYAGFLKAMQRGGDVMALMASVGMTPQAWGSCATAWTTVIQQKPQLAMQFMTLLSVP